MPWSPLAKLTVSSVLLALAWLHPSRLHAAGTPSYEDPVIAYSASPVEDDIARLAARLAGGALALKRDDETGYLRALLSALDIPVSSQVLVFSKTSLQRELIGPRRPRAIFFNDDVYVGWVPGGEVLEIAAMDRQQGAIFYTLEQNGEPAPRPVRQTHACLHCHDSGGFTGGVPGFVVRSVFPDSRGFPLLSAGAFVTDQTSPFEQRWGGWYVTGMHGAGRHMGNVIAEKSLDGATMNREAGANLLTIADRIGSFGYPAAGSDIVALLVLEHQTQAHNLMTRANFEARLAMQYQSEMNLAMGEPAGRKLESTTRRLRAVVEPLVKYLLFSGEAPLPSPVVGSGTFAADYMRAGRRDRRGRSLRELDLKTHLYRHRLSPLIYTPAFDALPKVVRDDIVRRINDVLDGRDRSPAFAHLPADERKAIRAILADTKPDLLQPVGTRNMR